MKVNKEIKKLAKRILMEYAQSDLSPNKAVESLMEDLPADYQGKVSEALQYLRVKNAFKILEDEVEFTINKLVD